MSEALQARARTPVATFTFFALAFLGSWIIGYATTQIRSDFPNFLVVLAMASGFGPSLAAVAVAAAFSEGTGVRDTAYALP